MAETTFVRGTGKRKCAIARVRITRGSGAITVNGLDYKLYFPRVKQAEKIEKPFEAIGKIGEFDVVADIHGGGVAGHADALSLGIARALVEFDATFRGKLKESRCLTRDARIKERKK